MAAYRRAVWGAEAGAIAAGTLELSFFLLDLVRLQPLATPGALAAALPGPGGHVVDVSTASGIVDGILRAYQLGVLTAVHFLVFALVGVIASFLFDWGEAFGATRLVALATLCGAGFFATVAITGGLVALDSVGWLPIVATNVLAAAVLGGSLRLVASEAEAEAQAEGT